MDNPVLELLTNRPRGAGKVFFVENTNGSDSNEGTDPNHPLAGIQAAIDLCTDLYNDYVFVMRRATSDHTTTTPILMNKHTTHLIGLANMTPQGSLIRLVHTNETDDVLDFPQDAGYHCEIAGFGFGGGTTGRGGIGLTGGGGGGTGSWIHHCNFGGLLTKGTPDYGIYNQDAGAEAQSWTIEECSFYGSGNNAKGLISVNAINLVVGGSANCKNTIIRKCIFMGIPGVAINLGPVSGMMILDNTFMLDADTAGAAITIASGATGVWVDGNRANFGSADACTGPAWLNNAGADAVTFGTNWVGNAVQFPAT